MEQRQEPWDPTGNNNQYTAGQPSTTQAQAAPESPRPRPTRPTYTPSTSTSSIPTYPSGSGDHSHLPKINRRPLRSQTPSESSNSPTGTSTTDSHDRGLREGTPHDEEHYEGFFDTPGYFGPSGDYQSTTNLVGSRGLEGSSGHNSERDVEQSRGAIGLGPGGQSHVTQFQEVNKPGIAKRFLDRGSSTLQRMKTIGNRKSHAGIPHSPYAKLADGDDDDEAEGEYHRGFDMSSYDSFPLYNDDKGGQFNVNTSYGGPGIELRGLKHQGSAVDLSANEMSFGSSRSLGTFYGQEMPVDLDPPNWRPWEMNWPYLSFLNFLTFALAGVTQYLIMLSDDIGEEGLIQYDRAADVPIGHWILWKYIPTVVGVLFGVLWQVTDTEVKRNEPYFQMSRPNGAIAKYSLNVDYFEFLSFLTPFQGAKYKQWAVTCSATCYFISYAIIPNLLSAILDVEENDNDLVRQGKLKDKYLRVDNRYARPLQAMFLFVGLVGVTLQILLWRRKSGLVGDVTGIAGIAAMANKSHILMDFKGLDEADDKRIHEHLSKRRYRLHKMSLYLGADVAAADRPDFHESKRKKIKRGSPLHPIFTFLTAIPFAVFLLVVLAVMPILNYTIPGRNFLQILPFTATLLGILIKSIWEVLDKQLRIIQPFRTLSEGNARPQILTLDYTGTIPGWVTVKAIRNGHWLLALVTFDSVLIELLTVTMGSFLNRSAHLEETEISLNVSYALATVICTGLLATLFLVVKRRRKPFLPRQPGTIASVLTFIHQSKMVTDFEKMEDWATYQREQKLIEINKRYAFGWFSGRDKEIHLGIDQCPISSHYEYGKDYKKGVMGTIGGYDYY